MLFTPNFETKIWTLRKNQDSSDQATFFWSSIIYFWWVHVNCSFWFLFLADSSSTWCGLCSSPSTSMFDRSCVQRCSSVNLGCNKLLFELLLPSYQLRSFSLFSSDISKAFSPRELPLAGYFQFLDSHSDGYVGKSQQINSFWNTQTSPTGTVEQMYLIKWLWVYSTDEHPYVAYVVSELISQHINYTLVILVLIPDQNLFVWLNWKLKQQLSLWQMAI